MKVNHKAVLPGLGTLILEHGSVAFYLKDNEIKDNSYFGLPLLSDVEGLEKEIVPEVSSLSEDELLSESVKSVIGNSDQKPSENPAANESSLACEQDVTHCTK